MADRTPSRPGRPSSTGRSGGGARPASPRQAQAPGAKPGPKPGPKATSKPGAGAGTSGSTSTGRPSSARSTSRAGASRSSATRPGQSRPGAARASRPGAGKERPALAARPRTPQTAPPSASTAWVRGAILLGILVMLAVTIVPTLRSLVQQRGDAAAMQDKVAAQRDTVAQLEREAALWKDPAYIEVQARERLKFVRVGDRAYTVIDPSTNEASAPASERPVVAAPMANAASPWYGKVWQSIQIADRPTAGVNRPK
ncbi:septum formation initiator [Terrabacter sp. Root85]|uniref:FtsB family cell division protein n=1 Tax=Terrabacter sp. Root85 TaxID=1736603 RepID=UPI0006FDF827|nr:septum formation initiator family protein [Terrabacter sp. Root85]KRC87320.1 septum formation initiator [Terrabacter sp. Root85]